jgi:hypothetical protein
MSKILILDPINALIQHLTNGKTANYSTVKTIAVYAGQLSDALKRNDIVKMRDLVPAVYVLLINSEPVSFDPEHIIDLLIVTESRSFDQLDKHTDAITICGQIANYLEINRGWTYNGVPYLIDESVLKVDTLTVDDRYSVFAIHLRITEKL